MPYSSRRINPEVPIIGVAVHSGHELRGEIAENMLLDEASRAREEDPYTGLLAARLPTSIVVHRSRFEVDLNRPREEALYLRPEDAWGLELWAEEPGPAVAGRSLDLYDDFYESLGGVLDEFVFRHGGFVLYDVHSYNHRRDGGSADPAQQEENPDLNLGTGSLPSRWKPVAEVFVKKAREFGIDARENVKFEGRQVAAWVHHHFGEVGCALAIEFKKSFMDEWTEEVYLEKLERLGAFLESSIDPVLQIWAANASQ